MLLSVIMTVYNGEKFVGEAIDSVLNQSFSSFELIIMNDGSTDNTPLILATYNDSRITIINQENLGVAKSRNKAIDVAKGKYIAILDSDDIALPQRFEMQLAFLADNNDYVLVGSNALLIDEEGNSLYTSNLPIEAEQIKAQFPISSFFHSSVMFKKDVFLNMGGYDTALPNHMEDLLLWLKFSESCKMANLECVLIKYRLSLNSLTNKSSIAFKTQSELANKIISNKPISTLEINNLIEKNKLSPRKRRSIYHLRLAKIYLTKNLNQKLALKNIIRSINTDPFNYSILKPIGLLIINALKSLIRKV